LCIFESIPSDAIKIANVGHEINRDAPRRGKRRKLTKYGACLEVEGNQAQEVILRSKSRPKTLMFGGKKKGQSLHHEICSPKE